MKDETLTELYKPFALKSRKGVGGKTFDYVATDDVTDRLNQVFKGNWSSEVVDFREIEDQVLIRVRVVIDHPDAPGRFLTQEGYASQLIARYTSGPQKDKIIDIGNVYKSAYSKAIKVAVEKWGVGLHLSRDAKDEESMFPETQSAVINPFMPEVQSLPVVEINSPKLAREWEATTWTGTGTAPLDLPVSKPSTGSPNNSDMSNFFPPDFSLPPTDKKNSGPINTSRPENIVVSSGAVKDVPDFGLKPSPNKEITYVTPIQQTAIEHIMQWSNLTFKELLDKSLKRSTDLPESLDKIKYEDGIKIIQYGNTTRGLK